MIFKRLFSFAAIAVLAFSVSGCLAGKFMANYALKPEVHGVADIERTRHKADSLLPGSTQWYDTLKDQDILKDTVITGYRDFKVHACYVPAKDPSNA